MSAEGDLDGNFNTMAIINTYEKSQSHDTLSWVKNQSHDTLSWVKNQSHDTLSWVKKEKM
jgi:hypothetical protein